MDLTTFRVLLTPPGQAALADAEMLAPTAANFLASFETLRQHHPPALAKAAIETVLFRRRARVKFTAADRMYFTREALEQATGEVAARRRAQRFSSLSIVADLGCGIGGDALALAASGIIVHAVDSDPLRLAMAQANARALGLADRILFHAGDALSMPLADVRAAFADPARRTENRRHLNPEDYTPPLSALRARFGPEFPIAVKIAPGVHWDAIAGLGAEVEFVSVEGELKECVLWFGSLRTAARRATVLPAGVSYSADDSPSLPPVAQLAEYIFDPDPAVVRAGLGNRLAEEFRVAPIDHTVQIFTGNEAVLSPIGTVYRVEYWARYHAADLRHYLRKRGIGRITVVKRGSRTDVDELIRKLRLAGPESRVVFLTRAAGEPAMIVCERVTASSV